MNIEHINKYENADMYLSHDKNQSIKILNSEVTTEEVQKAAKDLKHGKASGPDGILNEMLKITCNINTKVCVCVCVSSMLCLNLKLILIYAEKML
jgi:predicted transcriptional regulator